MIMQPHPTTVKPTLDTHDMIAGMFELPDAPAPYTAADAAWAAAAFLDDTFGQADAFMPPKAFESDVIAFMVDRSYTQTAVAKTLEFARDHGSVQGLGTIWLRDEDRDAVEALLPPCPAGEWDRFPGLWVVEPAEAAQDRHLLDLIVNAYTSKYPGDVDAYLASFRRLVGWTPTRMEVADLLAIAWQESLSTRAGRTRASGTLEQVTRRFLGQHTRSDVHQLCASFHDHTGIAFAYPDAETFLAVAWHTLGR